MRNRLYFDHNASTPLLPEVEQCIQTQLSVFGNPSSPHRDGQKAKALIESARHDIASLLNTNADTLIFTSSATESNHHILHSVPKGAHIVSSKIEHPSILAALEELEKNGRDITLVSPEKNGLIDPEKIKAAIRDNTALISIIWANNETGTIQPIKEIAKIAKAHNSLCHSDAVQALGKEQIDLADSGLDAASFSAHKVYACKGTGMLYCKNPELLTNTLRGGGQEMGLRAGTENSLGILAFATALKHILPKREKEIQRLLSLKTQLTDHLSEITIQNGESTQCLANTINLQVPGLSGEALMMNCDLAGISISTGSACSTGSIDPSHVLLAMGLSEEQALSSIRISLGIGNTEEEIEQLASTIKALYRKQKEKHL